MVGHPVEALEDPDAVRLVDAVALVADRDDGDGPIEPAHDLHDPPGGRPDRGDRGLVRWTGRRHRRPRRGRGIDETDRVRIFERFYRMADHAPVTGTGLGLPIARELARAMGGDLDVASLRGAGSSFVLVLPGPGVPATAEAIATALGATLVAETDRLRTVAILRAADEAGTAAGPAGPTPTTARSARPAGRRPSAARRRRRRLRLGPTVPATAARPRLSTNPPGPRDLVDNPVDARPARRRTVRLPHWDQAG